jgi:hypothetical protein
MGVATIELRTAINALIAMILSMGPVFSVTVWNGKTIDVSFVKVDLI